MSEESLSTFCLCLEIYPESQIKDSGLIILTEEISRQLNVQAVAQLPLGLFSQIEVGN